MKDTTYKVINNSDPNFPEEIGTIITVGFTKVYEWVDEDGIHSVPFTDTRYFQRIPSKKILKMHCTLTSIGEDYGKYGYLEDYQVEWLMEQLRGSQIQIKKLSDFFFSQDTKTKSLMQESAIKFLDNL